MLGKTCRVCIDGNLEFFADDVFVPRTTEHRTMTGPTFNAQTLAFWIGRIRNGTELAGNSIKCTFRTMSGLSAKFKEVLRCRCINLRKHWFGGPAFGSFNSSWQRFIEPDTGSNSPRLAPPHLRLKCLVSMAALRKEQQLKSVALLLHYFCANVLSSRDALIPANNRLSIDDSLGNDQRETEKTYRTSEEHRDERKMMAPIRAP